MNTTSITSSKAIIKVSIISAIPAVIGAVASRETSYLIPSGNDFESSCIAAFTFSASSTAFEPGAWYSPIIEHCLLLRRVNAVYVSTPSSTLATCFILTCEPPSVVLTTISPNSSSV